MGLVECAYCHMRMDAGGAPPAPAPYGGAPAAPPSPYGAPLGHGPPPAPMPVYGPPPIGAPPMIQVRSSGAGGAAMAFVIFIFAMVAVIFAVVGISVFSTLRSVSTAVESATQMSTPSQPTAITGNTGVAGANATCDRARRCCTAYAEAIGQPSMSAQICGPVEHGATSPMPDAVCSSLISGWRQSLTGMQKAVPADCQ
ncbi:MAG: hypothetical protein IT379_00735 [Deltaproteobacteria bacterium]|nr:hypothetical protein [Deltaproteobacteria bacterium]